MIKHPFPRKHYRTLPLLLAITMMFLSFELIAQEGSTKEIDDRPAILKDFQGSEEDYQKVKKKYYEENRLVEEENDTWTSVSKNEELECDIVFNTPKNLSKPSDLIGVWEIVNIETIGSKDIDKDYGDPTTINDFNSDNRLILNNEAGTFSHFSPDKSYWSYNSKTITITSFYEEQCMIETIDFTVLEKSRKTLHLNAIDPDGQEGVSYDIIFKLLEK